MSVIKTYWVSDGKKVRLSVPVAKVDVDNRLVSGFATLDNVDHVDDVVTAESSKVAFAEFRGNIREMHQPIAAGRLVDFSEEEFYHDGRFYRGIFVTVYVSKGAEDTWQKVLDGTLSGFSIGGNVLEDDSVYDEETNKVIRYILKYELVELSLVDNPCNNLANVLSVVKTKDGSELTGMAAETEIVNILWCSSDRIAKNEPADGQANVSCPACGNGMEDIGWFERGDDAAARTAVAVNKMLKSTPGEGGENVSKKIKKSEEVETAEVEETSEVVEETEPVEEVESELDFGKLLDAFREDVSNNVSETFEKVQTAIDTATKEFVAKSEELEAGLKAVNEELAKFREERDGVAKRLDSLEKSSAIKKSGEVNEPVEKSNKGLWSGVFSPE